MTAIAGLTAIANYSGAANDPARVALLKALIADPDATGSSGSIAGGGATNTYLDEMSPSCAAQLIVELNALFAAVT